MWVQPTIFAPERGLSSYEILQVILHNYIRQYSKKFYIERYNICFESNIYIYRCFLAKSHDSWHFLFGNFYFSPSIWCLKLNYIVKYLLIILQIYILDEHLGVRYIYPDYFKITCAIRRTQKSLNPFEFFCMFSLGVTSSSSELLPAKMYRYNRVLHILGPKIINRTQYFN